jgi:L-iditol 2-dehydrogenase
MKAAYFYEPQKIGVEDLKPYDIREDELLVKIKASSICGTDLRIFKNGHFKIPGGTKRVLGHELAGEIVKVGAYVPDFKVGMRVAIPPNIGCGKCEYCRDGYNQMCAGYEAFGISLDGGFQEYMRVPSIALRGGNVFELPDHVSFEEAALIEPLSCCYNAFKELRTTYADTVLIIGAGPIGACHVMLNRVAGAKAIIVADIRNERLAAIKKFGADETINSADKDLKSEIKRITNGRGVDVVITAASVMELQVVGVEVLATHGRICFFGGLPKNTLVPLDTNLAHYKGLKLMGTTGSSNSDYYKSLQLVADGRVKVKNLISETFDLPNINKAFDFAFSGQGMKSMVVNA